MSLSQESMIRNGLFWPARSPDHKLVGQLDLTGRRPVVEVDGELTPFFEEIRRERGADGSEVVVRGPSPKGMGDENLTIHGILEGSPDLVTLVGAFTVRRGSAGHKLQCAYAVLGGHVTDANTYRAARIRLKYLDDWLGREHVSQAVTPVELSSGVHLRLGTRTAPISWASRGTRTSRAAEFELSALPDGCTLADIWGLADPLSTLLTLAVNQGCPPKALEVCDEQLGWLHVIDPRLDNGDEVPLESHSLLLPWPWLDLSHLATWIANYQVLRPIPALAAAAVDWTTRPLESELLELAAAVEGLHQRLPHWKDKNGVVTRSMVKKAKKAIRTALDDDETAYKYFSESLARVEYVSYADRLEDLLRRASVAAPSVAGSNVEEWMTLIRRARNDLAHRPAEKDPVPGPRLQWQEYVALTLSLRWLLTVLLLLEAGVDTDVLRNRLGDDQQYILFQIQARNWLPSVFGDSN